MRGIKNRKERSEMLKIVFGVLGILLLVSFIQSFEMHGVCFNWYLRIRRIAAIFLQGLPLAIVIIVILSILKFFFKYG